MGINWARIICVNTMWYTKRSIVCGCSVCVVCVFVCVVCVCAVCCVCVCVCSLCMMGISWARVSCTMMVGVLVCE